MADGRDIPDSTAGGNWGRVAEIVAEALELDVAERSGFVAKRCRNSSGVLDRDLVREVSELIAASEAADKSDALRPPVGGLAAAVASAESLQSVTLPGQIGAWKPIRRLGAGGMGVVYEALRDDNTFEQRAAVKLVHPGFVLDFERHFLRERAVLAGLKHPGIARLLDGGRTTDGTPWLAMELVEGETLTAFAEQHKLGTDERVALFLQACEAVAYAHQNLVVHRDLKPAHVLVEGDPSRSQIKLLDFGIAKLVSTDTDAAMTSTGRGPLTAAYAAPEQVLGQPVTTATDVYSLGLVLYELLAGRRAYDVSNLTAAQTERVISEQNPPPPSTVIADRSVSRQVAGDLDTIVMKAIAKDPTRRYATAAALGDDLRRHLTDHPIEARPESPGYLVRKFVSRNRVAVTASILALALVAIVATAFTAGLARERNRARVAAQAATASAERAEAISGFLERILRAPNDRWYVDGEAKGPDAPITAVLAEAAARIDEDFSDRPGIRADLHHLLGDTYMSLGLSNESRTHHLATLALRREIFDPPHPELAEALYYASLVQDDLPAVIRTLREAVDMQIEVNEGNNFPFMVQSLVPWELDLGNFGRADTLTRLAYEYADTHFGRDATSATYRLPAMGYLASQRAKTMSALGRRADAMSWIARGDSLLAMIESAPSLVSTWLFLRESEAIAMLSGIDRAEGLRRIRALLDGRLEDVAPLPAEVTDGPQLSVYVAERLANTLVDATLEADQSEVEPIPDRYAQMAVSNRNRIAALRQVLGGR